MENGQHSKCGARSAECGMGIGVDKVGEKVNSPDSKCGARSGECGMEESQIPPHPAPLPGGEGEPCSRFGLILVSDQCHRVRGRKDGI
jgi:hypothetical protein